MDLKIERNATIFYLKFLRAIFVTNDLNELLRMARELGIDYTSLELLKMLRDLVIPHTQSNSLPEISVQNLYNYLNICRFEVDDDDKKERFEICNEILGYINSSKGKVQYPLYQSMINSFYSNFFERIKYHALFATEPEIVTPILSSATELEYLILFFHSEVIEEDEFEEDISEDLVLSLVYLLAVDHLLREYPSLLKDKLFLSRLSYILNNNELLFKEYNGSPDEDCLFELAPDDEDSLKDKKFWKLHQKSKKEGIKSTKRFIESFFLNKF